MKQSTKDTIDRYVKDHCPTGDFLYAVFTNNLKDSFALADDENKKDLEEIVKYCYWEIPSKCWGSVEKVKEWLSEEKRASVKNKA